jgi:hypothetical protein
MNARLPYRSSETSSDTGRRVVGPYLPDATPDAPVTTEAKLADRYGRRR